MSHNPAIRCALATARNQEDLVAAHIENAYSILGRFIDWRDAALYEDQALAAQKLAAQAAALRREAAKWAKGAFYKLRKEDMTA